MDAILNRPPPKKEFISPRAIPAFVSLLFAAFCSRAQYNFNQALWLVRFWLYTHLDQSNGVLFWSIWALQTLHRRNVLHRNQLNGILICLFSRFCSQRIASKFVSFNIHYLQYLYQFAPLSHVSGYLTLSKSASSRPVPEYSKQSSKQT